jgi:hypothetical protein
MTVQLVDASDGGPVGDDGGAGGAVVVRELSLKQFLASHAKLKVQARRARAASLPPPPPPPPPPPAPAYVPPPADGARGFAPPPSAGARARPVSASPFASRSPPDAGGAGRAAWVGAPPPPARPVRPASAHVGDSGRYAGAGSSPAFTGLALASRGSSGGGGAAPRAAWAAPGTSPGVVGGGHYSVTARPQPGGGSPGTLGDSGEEGLQLGALQPDARGDVSASVRQQLGQAAAFCAVRKAEVARLRNMYA